MDVKSQAQPNQSYHTGLDHALHTLTNFVHCADKKQVELYGKLDKSTKKEFF